MVVKEVMFFHSHKPKSYSLFTISNTIFLTFSLSNGGARFVLFYYILLLMDFLYKRFITRFKSVLDWILPISCWLMIYYSDQYFFRGLAFIFFVFRAVGLNKSLRHSNTDLKLIDYFNYMLFPFTLMAGPFISFEHWIEQVHSKRINTYHRFGYSVGQISLGWLYFLYAALCIDDLRFDVLDVQGVKLITNWIPVALCSVFVVTANMAGYSLLMQGLSSLFLGIKLPTNFRESMWSSSLLEFWKRHHITVSTWHFNHVYLPLVKQFISRGVKIETASLVGVLLTFLFSGLWHLSGLLGILWGLINALFFILSYLMESPLVRFVLLWVNLLVMFPLLILDQVVASAAPEVSGGRLVGYILVYLILDKVLAKPIMLFSVRRPLVMLVFVTLLLTGILLFSDTSSMDVIYSKF